MTREDQEIESATAEATEVAGVSCAASHGSVTGISTGLKDSKGNMIHVGALIKKPCEINEEFHGAWAIYRVKLQGIVPILSYVRSEKGQQLPEGYLACVLSDEYDRKNFVFACDPSSLSPRDDIEVVESLNAEPSEVADGRRSD